MSQKTIILLSGLPASGKDTAAIFFQKYDYFLMTYSSMILKPIIENPYEELPKYLTQTLPYVRESQIEHAIKCIEKAKQKETGRNLYITIGVKILPKIIKRISFNDYSHFNLFCDIHIKDKQKIVIAGFRMKDELQTLQTKYPDAKIIKILLITNDRTRHNRIKQRDNLDEKTITQNEKYEKQTTYLKLLQDINFNFIITNNSSTEDMEKQLEKIIKKIEN